MATRLTAEEKAAAFEEFVRVAEEGFERMFGLKEQKDLETLEQRETRAMEIGETLTRSLLQVHVQGDEKARVPKVTYVPCALCERPARIRGEPGLREVRTRAGKIKFERIDAFCARCRKVFSPSGLGP
jgi:hypothetical protein